MSAVEPPRLMDRGLAVVPYPIKYQAFMYVCKKLNAQELTAHAFYAKQKNNFHVVCAS